MSPSFAEWQGVPQRRLLTALSGTIAEGGRSGGSGAWAGARPAETQTDVLCAPAPALCPLRAPILALVDRVHRLARFRRLASDTRCSSAKSAAMALPANRNGGANELRPKRNRGNCRLTTGGKPHVESDEILRPNSDQISTARQGRHSPNARAAASFGHARLPRTSTRH